MAERLETIREMIIRFRDERDWLQFHDPKNLAEAIAVEAGELLEKFLWMTNRQTTELDDSRLGKIREEVADIFIFVLYLCDVLKIDLFNEVERKISINSEKYPITKSKGTSKKYSEL
jgi:NTP pyrophosphatase (non-canonical NTP hydrolase)